MEYNKKQIFTRAWQLMKENEGCLFSECLKEAWFEAKEKIKQNFILNKSKTLSKEKKDMRNAIYKEFKLVQGGASADALKKANKVLLLKEQAEFLKKLKIAQ